MSEEQDAFLQLQASAEAELNQANASPLSSQRILTDLCQETWRRFVLEKEPFVINHIGVPTYRDAEGRSCPMGRRMPSSVKLTAWENMTNIAVLLKRRRELSDYFSGIRIADLKEFQDVVDSAFGSRIRLAAKLHKFASEKGIPLY